ncbi:DUF5320 domain-containing protein [Candidatus Latescibacterota bacterium]
MPKGDKTGADGMGPMTGRGAGNCEGVPIQTDMNLPNEQGMGRLRGGRRGGRGRGKGSGNAQGGQRNRQ